MHRPFAGGRIWKMIRIRISETAPREPAIAVMLEKCAANTQMMLEKRVKLQKNML